MHDTTGHATRHADADATGEAGVWVDLATGADLLGIAVRTVQRRIAAGALDTRTGADGRREVRIPRHGGAVTTEHCHPSIIEAKPATPRQADATGGVIVALAERGMAAAELRAQELRADLQRARTGARWGWATAAAGFVLAAGLGGWALERHQRTAAAAGVQAALLADLRDRAERAELLADRLADGLTEGPRTLAGPWADDSVTIP